jgi:hypothetical protein
MVLFGTSEGSDSSQQHQNPELLPNEQVSGDKTIQP